MIEKILVIFILCAWALSIYLGTKKRSERKSVCERGDCDCYFKCKKNEKEK